MPKLWIMCLFALSSTSFSFGFDSEDINGLDGSLQDGCSGPEETEEEEEFLEEEEEIDESVIEAWAKAYRSQRPYGTQKYEESFPKDRKGKTISCGGRERIRCRNQNGTCQNGKAECLGNKYMGKFYCSSWRRCSCCSPSECNKRTKPYCSETCHGTCMNRHKQCPGYYLLGKKYCHSVYDCKCCVKPPITCKYQGVKYSHGSQLPGSCVEIVCQDGQWCPTSKISRDCSLCYARDDPHFDTFDNSVFDWHGQCNYSLAQSDQSYYPSYAVYGDLADCMGGATCLSTLVFRDDPNTVITIGQGDTVFQVDVNGVYHSLDISDCAQYIPGTNVLVWNNSDCIRILGTQGIVLNFCFIIGKYQEVYIWAPPRLNSSLYGLCGHNNGIEGDDFVLRDGNIIPWDNFRDQFSFPYPIAPEQFPNSWQTDPTCDPSHTRRRRRQSGDGVDVSEEFPCQSTNAMWNGFRTQCETIVDEAVVDGEILSESMKKRYTATCAFDMCMIYQASENNVPDPMPTMENWELAVAKMVKRRIEIEVASRVCPAGFDVVGDECFKMHELSEPWSISRLLCQAEGTYLAEPSDPELLLTYLKSHGKTNHFWMGGRGNGTNMLWTRSRQVVNGLLYQQMSTGEMEVHSHGPITKDVCLEIRADSESGPLALWECEKRHYFICQYNNRYAYK